MVDHLDAAVLPWTRRDGGQGLASAEPELTSVDFLVNGRSLHAACRASRWDRVGCFMSLAMDGVREAQEKMFAGEAPTDLPDNRLGLFVCSLCGDLSCGAISFKLKIDGNRVGWSDFADEVDWVALGDPDESRLDFEPFRHIGPFEFDLPAYRSAIRKARALVSNRG